MLSGSCGQASRLVEFDLSRAMMDANECACDNDKMCAI